MRFFRPSFRFCEIVLFQSDFRQPIVKMPYPEFLSFCLPDGEALTVETLRFRRLALRQSDIAQLPQCCRPRFNLAIPFRRKSILH
jgi:hypothetical protein